MNCLSPDSAESESTKSRKLLRISPKNLRKRKPEKAAAVADGALAGGAMAAVAGNGDAAGTLDHDSLKQAFDLFDKNRDGRISGEELGGVLRTLGHDYSQADIDDMIKHADTNENGTVEYDEFLVLMKRWSRESRNPALDGGPADDDKTKETFKVFDMDGNGFIDRHELRYIMKRLGENLGEDDIQHMFDHADINGDGLIDYDEFTKLLGGLGGGLGLAPPPQPSPTPSPKSGKSKGKKK